MKNQTRLKAFFAAAALAAVLVPTCSHAEHKLLVAEFPGATHHGYLGVALHDVSEDRAAQLKLKDARGVEVTMLDHDGPAAKVGIREHDVILQMNGQDVASEEQLRRMLRETPAGRKANLLLSRDGEPLKLQVVLGDRAATESAAAMDLPQLNMQLANVGGLANLPDSEDLAMLGDSLMDMGAGFGPNLSGAMVEALGPQLAKYFGAADGKGVLVKEVQPQSAAAKAGIKAGDVIVKAAGKPVASRTDWERTLRTNSGKPVAVELLRDKHQQKLTLTVAANTQGKLAPQGFEMEWPLLNEQLQAQLAELQSNDWQQQIAAATAKAEKAAAAWKKQPPQMEEQIRKAGQQAKDAAEKWQRQVAPME